MFACVCACVCNAQRPDVSFRCPPPLPSPSPFGARLSLNLELSISQAGRELQGCICLHPVPSSGDIGMAAMSGSYRGSRDPNLDTHAYNVHLIYYAKLLASRNLYMEIVLKGISPGG